ncbi:adenylosuccinate synthetase [Flavobacterium sp. I3-2]|uniref:adenylosuccinate synthetase n=1 Tax=Flavobacterium sp. I3-2 TaxID=2748319 RepID=UPI0015AD5B43|nr:adenylosuccinate synthetase [Flavobacterium sp. I3-2]
MKKAQIVIGLGFGDEGKGITTDYLASQKKEAIVIRFSGGQQAAHTVMIENKKHIHSSFCSGALRGLPSYISEFCTFYPIYMLNEKEELEKLNGNTKMFIHPLAKVTTPFDIYYNRKNKKNIEDGTCGKGIGTTMKRNESPFKLFATDLIGPKSMLIEKLKSISNYYGLDNSEEIKEELEFFLYAIEKLEWNIKDYTFLLNYNHLIFEGSQGILLDMDHGIFPNVTYSNTTSKNAITICNLLKIKDIEIFYVTRIYSTRHGNGWMSNETNLTLKNNQEETCIYNDFQKGLRIGNLDYELLNYALIIDGAYNLYSKKNLVVTCLDQLDIPFDSKKIKINFDSIIGSYSPYSKDFKILL